MIFSENRCRLFRIMPYSRKGLHRGFGLRLHALSNRWNFSVRRGLTRAAYGRFPMNHKGVDYSLTRSQLPEIWKWKFRIGDRVKSGTTEARLLLLAMRRVQSRIDRELKHPDKD
jgi:hypothetical protein